MSALEDARRIVESADNAPIVLGPVISIHRAATIARAYIKACEALEELSVITEAYDLSGYVRELARAALSCSAPTPDK